jgi:hypothetical protein
MSNPVKKDVSEPKQVDVTEFLEFVLFSDREFGMIEAPKGEVNTAH